ncbi:MAG: class II glutamine amidotransferase [Alphaproteobacteria bacterium]|nr:class II glutamine amidotransferase [Alphaproteobacteria bacterium]
MCRWLAYNGQPIFIEQLITLPEHSLVEQSFNTELNYSSDGRLMATNGDGFGIGWYGERSLPGLYKDERPAWSNHNFREICHQIRARIFLAHVRATTTGSVQQANCHPFKYKNWLFQHNGEVTEFPIIRQELQADIDRDIHMELKGTTDSETFFLLALTYGLEKNPKEALQKMVQRVQRAMRDNGYEKQGFLNLSCALSDGQKLYTLRYAYNTPSKTQFFSAESGWIHERSGHKSEGKSFSPEENIVVVSEPLDYLDNKWHELPDNSFTTIYDSDVHSETFMD